MTQAGLTVLIVEDETIIRFTLAEVLEEAGYTVLEAANVLEAVAIIGKRDDISAVISDIDMPGALSGFDLIWMIDRCQQHIATILTSGGHLPGETDIPQSTRFLAKPYCFDDVVGALVRSIDEKAGFAGRRASL
jgi:DNA-binding NtrC family response regulator